MVFVCASAQVAANGSTTREMMDALNICPFLRSCQAPKRSAGASVNELKRIRFMQGGVGCALIKPTICERVPEDERISKGDRRRLIAPRPRSPRPIKPRVEGSGMSSATSNLVHEGHGSPTEDRRVAICGLFGINLEDNDVFFVFRDRE